MPSAASSSNNAARKNVGVDDVVRLISEHERILIVSHLRPDGDCLGSTIALLHALESIGKKVAAYNSSGAGDKFLFLPGIEKVSTEMPEWDVDLTIFVDCGGLRRVSEDFAPPGITINIDHHSTNDRFADYNWIDIEACAVGDQIHRLLGKLGVALTPAIATGIYTSILTDTGAFRYSNTTAGAFRLAAELVEAGADPATISMEIYESRHREEFNLTGRVYSRLTFEAGGAAVWSEIRQSDYEACGGTDAEPEGLASDIRGIRGVEISCLMHEMEDGTLRAGFRGKGNIDCAALAQTVGGGGHFNASGAVVRDLPYEEAKAKLVGMLRDAAEKWQA